MMPQIKRWLAPPIFHDDEDKTVRALLLHITLLSVLGFLAIAMLGSWIVGRTPAAVLGLDGVAIGACLLFYYWMRQGKVRFVSLGLITLGFIIITLAVAVLGTIRSPTTSIYLMLVIVTGLLFGLRGLIGMTILSSLAILGLIVAENARLLPVPDLSVTITQWIIYTALFAASGGLTIMVLASTRQALQRANNEIAGRARVEVQLRESEARFRRLFEQAPLGYQALDAEGRLIEVNQAWLDLLGYSRDQVIGRWFGDFLPPQQVEAFKRHFQGFKTAGAVQTDLEMVHRAGSTLAVHLDGRIAYDEQGRFKQTHCVLHDLTARKRAEYALRESEDRYRDLVEHSHAMICTHDLQGRILSVNPAVSKGSGYPEDVLSTMNVRDLWAPEVRDQLVDYFATLQSEGVARGVMLIQNNRGERRIWEYNNTLRIEGLATPIVRCMARDITESKQAEERLRRRSDEFAALYETSRELSTQSDLSALLQTIVERSATLLAVPSAVIYLYDDAKKQVELVVSEGVPLPLGTRLEMGEGVAGRVSETRQPLIVEDYRNWEKRSSKFKGIDMIAVLGVPMLFGGELIGVLAVNIVGDATRKFTEDDTRLLSLFAGQAASAVHNARLLREAKQRADQFLALYETTRDLSVQQDLRALLKIVVDRATALLHAPSGFLYLYDPSEAVLKLEITTGLSAPRDSRIKLGSGIAGRVAQTNQPMIVDDYKTWEDRSPRYATVPYRSIVEVPMNFGGELIGVLGVSEFGKSERKFTKEDARLLFLFAGQAASAVHNLNLFEKLQRELAERKRAERLLLTLNRSAEAMAGAITPDEVFSAVSSQLNAADLSCVALPLNESGSHFIARYLSYAPDLLQKLERLSGIKHENFTIPIDALDIFKLVRLEKRAGLVEDPVQVVRQVLPKPLKGLAPQIAKMLRVPKFIAAPMIADETFVGVFAAQSENLTEADVPAIFAFAHLVAQSLRKAELYQQAQSQIAERKRAEESLWAANEYSRNIIESSMDMIIAVDKGRRITEFNKAAQEAFGYTLAEVFGKEISIIYADPPKGQLINQALSERGRATQVIWNRRKNGEIFPSLLSASLLRNTQGETIGFMGISRDITEQKRAEEALQRAHDELEKRVQERTAELQQFVDLMAGREVRMIELKDVIKQLRAQMQSSGLKPLTDDPLAAEMEEEKQDEPHS